MAQMDWRKYPEVMPPADDTYLVVNEYHTRHGSGPIEKERVVTTAFFAHNMSEACPEGFDGEEHPGWFDATPDFHNEEFNYFEVYVTHWMPFPKMPEE